MDKDKKLIVEIDPNELEEMMGLLSEALVKAKKVERFVQKLGSSQPVIHDGQDFVVRATFE